MSKYAAVNVKFGADITGFSTAMQNAAREMKRAGDQLTSVGSTLTRNLTAPIVALGAASLYAYGQIDQLKRGLITFMGSASAAEAEFTKLREVAKLPGIGLEEAVRGSNNLQAIGLSADEARTAMMAFGNAIATVGGGRENFDLAIRGFGQLTNASKPLQQDLYQIANQLPQVNKLMKEAFGTNRAEELAAMGISGRQLADFLVESLGKLPPVTGGIKNAFENMSDSIKIALAGFGEAIDKNFDITGKLTAFSEWMSELSTKFNNLNPFVQKTILVIVGLVAALGPLLIVIGGVVTLLPTLLAGFAVLSGPVGLLALAIAAIGYSLSKLSFGSKEAKQSTEELSQAQKNLIANTQKEKEELAGLITRLKETKQGSQQRLDLINQVNSKFGGHLQNIQDEAKFLGHVSMEYMKIVKAMEKKAIAESVSLDITESAIRQRRLEQALETEIANKPKQYADRVSPEQKQHEQMMNILRTNIQKEKDLRAKLGIQLNVNEDIQGTKQENKVDTKKLLENWENNFKAQNDIAIRIRQNESISRALKGNSEDQQNVVKAGWLNLKKVYDEGATGFTNEYNKTGLRIAKLNEDLGRILQQGVQQTVVSLAQAFGENLVDGDPFNKLGLVLMDSLGSLMQQLGGAFITLGVLGESFQTAVKGMQWYVAAGIGFAMVAAGAAISKVASKGMQPQNSSYGAGMSSSTSSSGQNMILTTRLEGRDLVLSGQRTQTVTKR